MEANNTGVLKCEAINGLTRYGDTEKVVNSTFDFYIIDKEELKDEGMNLWGKGINIEEKNGRNTSTVVVGDDVELFCGVSVYGFDESISWKKINNGIDENGEDLQNNTSK